jgi:hypothetical protein
MALFTLEDETLEARKVGNQCPNDLGGRAHIEMMALTKALTKLTEK